jgi:hypothetical protein
MTQGLLRIKLCCGAQVSSYSNQAEEYRIFKEVTMIGEMIALYSRYQITPFHRSLILATHILL